MKDFGTAALLYTVQNEIMNEEMIHNKRKRRDLSHLSVAEKQKLRKQSNRQAAQNSRQRSKAFVQELQSKLRNLEEENKKLLNHTSS